LVDDASLSGSDSLTRKEWGGGENSFRARFEKKGGNVIYHAVHSLERRARTLEEKGRTGDPRKRLRASLAHGGRKTM